MTKKISFYIKKATKKCGAIRPKKRSFSIYKIGETSKNSFAPPIRADGIRLLNNLGFETYKGFMEGLV